MFISRQKWFVLASLLFLSMISHGYYPPLVKAIALPTNSEQIPIAAPSSSVTLNAESRDALRPQAQGRRDAGRRIACEGFGVC
ncbi:MAG: hypothetical protein ACRC8A_15025 [Microcoleaceae cyanobacterium]